MSTNSTIERSLTVNALEKWPVPTLVGCLLLIAAGTAAFFYGLFNEASDRILQIYLVNFIFWTGLSFGAIFFIALLNMTNARWGRPLKRLAESFAAYLPVSFLLFWVLFWGRKTLFPWITEPVAKKAFWLNVPFFFAREGIGLFILTAAAVALVVISVKRDRDWMRTPTGSRFDAPATDADGSKPAPGEEARPSERFLSYLFAALYVLVMTIIAWDLIMSLTPEWNSTLFGPYFFIGCLYTALSAIFVLTVTSRSKTELASVLRPKHFHDLGKMQLAFLMVTGDFFFSQYLLIWYGNVPEETRFLILRFRDTPWESLSVAVLVMIFAIPFVLLLNRRIKMKPRLMLGLSLIILSGMWLQNFLLVVPSLWEDSTLPLGILEFLVSAGFFGTVGLCLIVFLRHVPLLPVADPLFRKELESIR